MGNRLGEQDGYPVGVTNAHPHFHEDDAPCICGHVLDEHEESSGECTIDDCDCTEYEACGEDI